MAPRRSAVLAIALCAAIEAAQGFHAPLFLPRTTKASISELGSIRGSQPPLLVAHPLAGSARRAATLRSPTMLLDDAERPERRSGGGGPSALIKDFVTQRALQTMLSNLDFAHQTDHRDFLSRFLEHEGVQDFHSYGGLKCGWMEYLTTLRKTAPFDIVRRKPMRKVGSANNPYIKQQFFEYSINIDPSRLAEDMCEVRLQIADEWQADLQLIAAENAELFRHHNEMMVNGSDTQLHFKHPLMVQGDQDSPLRKSNYDLLEKYATHVATQRVLHDMSRSKPERHSHSWLREYVVLHGEGFEGDHGFNVGRSFLAGLLGAPPSVVPGKKGSKRITMIDPLDIAARIMAERQCVADRWVEALGEVEEDHLEIKRKVLQDCFEANMINVLLDSDE